MRWAGPCARAAADGQGQLTETVLHVLDAARGELQAIESGARTLLRVGTYPVAAPVLLPCALAWLREHHASVHVQLQEGGSETLHAPASAAPTRLEACPNSCPRVSPSGNWR